MWLSRAGNGFRLHLSAGDRSLLRSIHDQLSELLTTGPGGEDPGVARLFPPAHRDDPDVAEAFREVAHDGLLAGRLDALDTFEATLDAERLTEDELLAWVSSLNDARLVLGTRLGVTEETTGEEFGDPESRVGYGIYAYLTMLVDEAVAQLSGADPS